jgi:hypothetical protein
MAALVDEHSVDGGAEIGAMIEVKAAQIILVGLALAAVLTDDQARGCLEQLARPIDLACSELLTTIVPGASAGSGVPLSAAAILTTDDVTSADAGIVVSADVAVTSVLSISSRAATLAGSAPTTMIAIAVVNRRPRNRSIDCAAKRNSMPQPLMQNRR